MKKFLLMISLLLSSSVFAVEYNGLNSASMSKEQKAQLVDSMDAKELVRFVGKLKIPEDCDFDLWMQIRARKADLKRLCPPEKKKQFSRQDLFFGACSSIEKKESLLITKRYGEFLKQCPRSTWP